MLLTSPAIMKDIVSISRLVKLPDKYTNIATLLSFIFLNKFYKITQINDLKFSMIYDLRF